MENTGFDMAYMENDLEMIRSKIYEIRGQKVMLDFDLAAMYGVETGQLKRAVRRNMERFEELKQLYVQAKLHENHSSCI